MLHLLTFTRWEHLIKHAERAFLGGVESCCVICLVSCVSFLLTASLPALCLCLSVHWSTLSPSGQPELLLHTACVSAPVCRGLLCRPPASLGCDMLAVAQRRQPFSVLLLPLRLLSSVIKGRGKSRGEGWALIAFHGREEGASACPGGPRRCWALCCLLCPLDRSCSRKTHADLVTCTQM